MIAYLHAVHIGGGKWVSVMWLSKIIIILTIEDGGKVEWNHSSLYNKQLDLVQ